MKSFHHLHIQRTDPITVWNMTLLNKIKLTLVSPSFLMKCVWELERQICTGLSLNNLLTNARESIVNNRGTNFRTFVSITLPVTSVKKYVLGQVLFPYPFLHFDEHRKMWAGTPARIEYGILGNCFIKMNVYLIQIFLQCMVTFAETITKASYLVTNL